MQTVEYDNKLELVTLTLSGCNFYDDCKQIWKSTLQLLQEKHSRGLLIDARRHKALAFEGSVWFKEEFLEEAYKYFADNGAKIAILISKWQANGNELREILRFMGAKGYHFQIKVFFEHQDGIEWLKDNALKLQTT